MKQLPCQESTHSLPFLLSMVLIALITHLLCVVQFCKHLRYRCYDMQIQVLRNRDIKWISEGGTFGSGARIWSLLDIFQSFVIYPPFLAESNEHIGLTWPIFTYKQTLLNCILCLSEKSHFWANICNSLKLIFGKSSSNFYLISQNFLFLLILTCSNLSFSSQEKSAMVERMDYGARRQHLKS